MIIDQFIKHKTTHSVSTPHWYSLLKAVSWRVVGTLDTIIISWIVTGQVKLALSIGMVELISKFILYYLHERVWEKFRRPSQP